MAIVSSKAIILHTIKYGDNSLIVNAFTEEYGRLGFIVNGVNGKKSALKAKLFQALYLHQVQFYYQPKKNLHRIKELTHFLPFQTISDDIYKRTLSLFIAEVLTRVLREEEKNYDLFLFITKSITLLDELSTVPPNFHLSFLIHLSSFLGFFPNDTEISSAKFFDMKEGIFLKNKPLHHYIIQEPDLTYFKRFVGERMSDSMSMKIPKTSQQKLLTLILDYYRLHLGNFQNIRSLEILQEVFA